MVLVVLVILMVKVQLDGGSGGLLVYYMQSYQRLDATETVLNDSFFNTPRKYKIVLPPGNGFSLYKDGVLLSTNSTWTNSNGADRFGLSQLTNAAYTYIKNTRVRKYASPEPTLSILGLEESPGCPTSPKYEGDTIHLSATPRDGIGPYIIIFEKNNSPILSLSNVIENTEVTYDYQLTNEDIRTASFGTINFSVYMEDSCPTTHQTCIQSCTIDIGCMAPVCNFTVT